MKFLLHFIEQIWLRTRSVTASDNVRQPVQPDDVPGATETLRAEFTKAFTLYRAGRHFEADVLFGAVLQKLPENIEAFHAVAAEGHYQRGMVMLELKRYDEALASYDRAIALDAAFAEAHFNRGAALSLSHRNRDAVVSFDRAIAINPALVTAHVGRGLALVEEQQYQEACASYDRALQMSNDCLEALNHRGRLCFEAGFPDEASQDFSLLVELAPDFDGALGHKLHAKLLACDWKFYTSDREQLTHGVRAGKFSSLPFPFLSLSDNSADHLTCAQTYVAHSCPPTENTLQSALRHKHDRIRVAYLSADLRDHAVAYLLADLIEQHDKSRFEISAWSFGPSVEDGMRTRLRQSFEHFNDVRCVSDVDVARLLCKNEIDIAIDLVGFTRHRRPGIFAQRAAPIQVGYLGYIGTMGASYMDYIIGDAEVIPVEHEAFYSEKVVRLPDTYQVNSARVAAALSPGRAEANLPETGFVFCSFNNSYKITPDFFDTWMRLLKAVDGSVLWLLESSPAVSRNLRLEAAARGVNGDRLVFAGRVSLPAYLARYRLADLFLDTLPYNAGTTASDALWMGLPVLTCRGNAFPGRMAASLLLAIGLPELITNNLTDYEALALKLASSPETLAEIKSRLRRNKSTSPLFDIDRFRQHIESAYTTMHERYQRGELPQSFSVQPIASNIHS